MLLETVKVSPVFCLPILIYKQYFQHTVHVNLTAICFIPPKACSERCLPIYYTVIVWDTTGIFKHLFTWIYFIIVQLRRPPFELNCFRNAFFKCTKLNFFRNTVQLCCKRELLVFCASTCDGNLVRAIKHFIVTFLETISSCLLCQSFMAGSKPSVSTYFKQSIVGLEC